MTENELENELKAMRKNEIIRLFVRLKKAFTKTSKRLYRLEEELAQNADLEKLIKKIK